MHSPGDPDAPFIRLLHAIDELDWGAVRTCLAHSVQIDATDLSGGELQTFPAADLVRLWQGYLRGFDATHHLSGPVIVEQASHAAVLRTHVRVYHRIDGADGGPIWVVHGHCIAQVRRAVAGWRVEGLTIRVIDEEGNGNLPNIAGRRSPHSVGPRNRKS